MRQVEFKNKLPASARNAEDVLTSNVFSLLKYSDRRTCLRQLPPPCRTRSLDVAHDPGRH